MPDTEQRFLPFARLMAATGIATVLVLNDKGFAPALRFAAVTVALGSTLFLFPTWLKAPGTLRESLARLWHYRMLILLWLKYNVLSRYSQTVLGILWIMLLPLATSAILALVFSQFLRMQLTDTPFITFFLTALVPWSLFSQGIFGSTTAILAHMTLINQVPFPREVLVIRTLSESLMDAVFMFLCLLLINALVGVYPQDKMLFLPVIVFIQACGMLGLMFFISAFSVFVRDVPQLVSVLMQLLFYLTPILYPIDFVPPEFRVLLDINPLSFLIQSYRDIILNNTLPDAASLYTALVSALLLLFAGYTFFKAHEHRLADYV